MSRFSLMRHTRTGATLALAVVTTFGASAATAAVLGPSDDSFYTQPTPIPAGQHGALLSYRSATVKLGADAPGVRAWNVLYKSTDSVGAGNVVSGTVLVPSTAWNGGGPRPVVLYAVGTHGLAQGCAPSRQLARGTDYENANIVAALKAGYAVLVSDYAGYLTGASPTYLAGASQGHAVLDIFKAAQAVPWSGISASAKVAVWGYSQGGQTAAWVGERLPAYAPEINVVGIAAGGIPGDFIKTSLNLDGNLGAAFLFSAVSGLQKQYPQQIPLDEIANAEGKQQLDRIRNMCVFEALQTFQNRKMSEVTEGGLTLTQVEAIPSVRAVLESQSLGQNKIPVPLYQYHGQADEFIPLDQALALKKKYCARGSTVAFDLYPSEHIATQFQGAPKALTFIADRLAGRAAPSTCGTTAPEPQSTANPGGGNFVVTLNNWPLNASTTLKTLQQTIQLPSSSTLYANGDLTAQVLEGRLSVPDFKTKISLLGLNITVGLAVTPVGDVSGTMSLDNDGQLSIQGTALADLTITSLLGIPFGQCKTSRPVEFPLNFKGPVSALGNGGLSFAGTTTFPPIKGCIISGVLSALMSGSGQGYSFAVAPPAPVKY